MSKRRFGRYTVEVSNEDKVLFPKEEFTKSDLIDYYETVADEMLPYLKGRPLSMKRFPDGIGKEGFFQKSASDYFPKWITTARLKKKGGTVDYVVCDKAATLVYLANQACIEYHAGLSRVDKTDNPDQLILDLDPEEDDFRLAQDAALIIKDVYDEVGLPVFVKTTGGKGIHLVTPLDRSASFEEARAFARDLAKVIMAEDPGRLTTETRKAKRKGRLFLDTGRNAYAQTAVAAYSVRARPGATVSMPIDWSELGDKRLKPSRFTIETVPKRLDEDGDVWRGMTRLARSLAEPSRRLKRLSGGG